MMHDCFSEEEKAIHDIAMAFVRRKANKKAIAKKYVDAYPREENPVSIFMAGSPGAGKTEIARQLLFQLDGSALHIDNDELRGEFEAYNGANSHLFQAPATRLVEAIHDRALKRKVSFILDSTLSDFDKAKQNIERSLNKERHVEILFVYQNPEKAWEFVMAREKLEGRRVPPEIFVTQFISSQVVVNELKSYFGQSIKMGVLVKNLDGSAKLYHSNVNNIDQYIHTKYNTAAINTVVGLG
ncbi:MAG: zeta toxin family protein [Osedax symbiont Rs1]|nr:MAG: zeta toxin family protein [Osedax symbiont Rs1]